jgi:hypothetical protein
MNAQARIASTAELAVVRRAVDLVGNTRSRYAALMRDVHSYPIAFFGPLASASVITFGLNPSADEFAARRSWPAGLSYEALANRLVGYFDGEPHPWFNSWSRALSVLGAAYGRSAAHVDLSPRATASVRRFVEHAERSLFLEMLRTDAPVWVDALGVAANARLLLVAGSATRQFYINEFIQDELAMFGVDLSPRWRRGRGTGQTAFQVLRLPSGRQLPVFFCSTGPAKPEVLLEAVSRNAPRLTRELTA